MIRYPNPRHAMIFGMIVAATLSRLLPHPPNFTPIGALALFGGAYIDKKPLAFAVPLSALLLSDMLIGFYMLMPVIYVCFALTVLMGFVLRKGLRVGKLAVLVVASSGTFFCVTNLAVWISGTLYPHTAAGLLTCYGAAIPFYRNEVIGDALYATLLFGTLAAAERVIPPLRKKDGLWRMGESSVL